MHDSVIHILQLQPYTSDYRIVGSLLPTAKIREAGVVHIIIHRRYTDCQFFFIIIGCWFMDFVVHGSKHCFIVFEALCVSGAFGR